MKNVHELVIAALVLLNIYQVKISFDVERAIDNNDRDIMNIKNHIVNDECNDETSYDAKINCLNEVRYHKLNIIKTVKAYKSQYR